MGFRPTPDFDNQHYIFIGEIVEIVKAVNLKSQQIKNDAVGLKIKVSENVYSPKLASYYEVFPLSLTPSCGLESEIKQIRERFPVGSKVRVVAKEATSIKYDPAHSIIQLETSIFNKGIISRNDLIANQHTSAKTIFDYKGFVAKQYTTKAEEAFFASNNSLPLFELRKDLFRLQESKSEEEKTKILERLVFYPDVDNFTFEDYAWNYLENKDKKLLLIKQWKGRVQEIHSKNRQY
jgi:hypothetical protein